MSISIENVRTIFCAVQVMMDENELNCNVISSYGVCTYSIIVSFPPTFVTWWERG